MWKQGSGHNVSSQCQFKLWFCTSHSRKVMKVYWKPAARWALNADILDSDHSHHSFLANRITQSANRWPQQNGWMCAKPADASHDVVLQCWHSGKWRLWWGALEQWLEWQNAPKAPARSKETASCSNQVHWAQEGPDVACTLTHSFQPVFAAQTICRFQAQLIFSHWEKYRHTLHLDHYSTSGKLEIRFLQA